MKDKRYKRVKKAIMAGASSGIVAGMILVGSGNVAYAETSDLSIPAYTQNTSANGMHFTHKWNSAGRAGVIASGLGLNKEQVKQELKSGKTMKQILQEHGIVLNNIDKNTNNKHHTKGWRKKV